MSEVRGTAARLPESHPSMASSGLSAGDWLAVGGDVLVFVGLLLAIWVYLLQRASAAELLRQSALAVLTGARDGIDPWASLPFSTDYSKGAGEERAKRDFKNVMSHTYELVYRAPTEPLASIIQQPDEGRFIFTETIEAVNIALWRIGQFNQLVQAQTDFIAQHIVEIRGDVISDESRLAVANAAESISRGLHISAIGDAGWYTNLITKLNVNIVILNAVGRRRWWQLKDPDLGVATASPASSFTKWSAPLYGAGLDFGRHNKPK